MAGSGVGAKGAEGWGVVAVKAAALNRDVEEPGAAKKAVRCAMPSRRLRSAHVERA